ncbi:endonuclease/exonuclease/phosphatase family protein [Solicola sp. PLA-1-18]|uniref:endonuclease/exonuclease/phosphatase family protein n=1 Tax=Solicola sp. PLA-1-18 TaxID=3380532 RepID=UPI003B82635D
MVFEIDAAHAATTNVGPVKPLTFATFNVRTSERGGPAWKPRRARVLKLMRRTNADIVVLQEATMIRPRVRPDGGTATPPLDRFPALWLARKAGYKVVPAPHHPGLAPYYWHDGAQILYRPSRLSLKVNTCSPYKRPSQKIADFTDRASGRSLRVVGMHLFHKQGKKFEQMRVRSLQHYDRFVRECITPVRDTTPTVWLGDLNTTKTTRGTLVGDELRSRGLRDSVKLAKNRSYTQLNTFRPGRTVKRQGKRIDQIWVPTGTQVHRWTQIVDIKNGRYSAEPGSDHNPVVASITLPR